MATGEVLLNGSQIGIEGATGFHLANLLDANAYTEYSTFPSNYAWAGMDAAVPCVLTRVRLSPYGGSEDFCLGAAIQSSTSSLWGTPAVQYAAKFTNTSGVTSQTAIYTTAQIAGDTLIVFIDGLATGETLGVTDTKGNTYTKIVSPANGSDVYVYVAYNIAQANASANTLTVTYSPSVSFPIISAVEYQNLPSGSFDVFGQNSGSGTALSVTITPNNLTDLVIAFAYAPGTTSTPAGFTFEGFVAGGGGGGGYVWAETVDNPSTINISCTAGASGGWHMCAVAFTASDVPHSFFTIGTRPVTGTLLNEFLTPGSTPYRYYRYLAPSGSYGSISDLDFIVQYTPGISAQCCTPTMSPPGGLYDLPTVVQMSCITTDAQIYYTLDGTTPTTASKLYTGPFVVQTTAQVKILAVSPNLTNSRIATYQITVPSTIISSNDRFDNRNGYKIWAIDPNFLHDPVSGWWYMYGYSEDEAGVFVNGWIGNNIYKSADMRNWTYVNTVLGPAAGLATGSMAGAAGQMFVFYNALNNNYVAWLVNSSGHYVYTSPTAVGPWTKVPASPYLSLDGNSSTIGDTTFFEDPVSGNVYIGYTWPGAETSFTISKLNSAYTNTDGSEVHNFTFSTAFGVSPLEAPTIFYNAPYYFTMFSGVTQWQPNLNLYWYATSLAGPWTAGGNPFQSSTDPNSLGLAGVQYGVSVANSYTIAFDSQNNRAGRVLLIPGRGNMLIYTGDRVDNNTMGGSTAQPPANFAAYRLLMLPMTIVGNNLKIFWNNSWSFDGNFPTVSGAPKPASNLFVNGSTASWFNNEPFPANLYLDSAPDGTFTTGIWSQVVPIGATNVTITLPQLFYRIRTVNANGTAYSSIHPPWPGVLPARKTKRDLIPAHPQAEAAKFGLQKEGLRLRAVAKKAQEEADKPLRAAAPPLEEQAARLRAKAAASDPSQEPAPNSKDDPDDRFAYLDSH